MLISVVHVNAFTANGGGNPAGVVFDAEKLTDSQMLQIAKQVGFSETAFVSIGHLPDVDIRFFTPTDEVALCGHATIGSWSYMLQQGTIASGTYTQNTKAGKLKVEVREDGVVYMEQTQAHFFEEIDTLSLARVLTISASNFHSRLKPQIVSTGLKDLLVPVANEKILDNIKPDFDAMIDLCKKYDITGLHVFALQPNSASVAIARNFAPLYGINEESATGTSNGALLCYLREHSMLTNQTEYRIEQGKTMNQLSYIYGKFKDNTVWIGGTASFTKKFEINL